MATNHCPNCGCNLQQFEPLSYGNVEIDERGDILFQGRVVELPKSQHLIVEALVRAQGRGLSRSLLANVSGGEINDQTISKYIERIRASFRALRPEFDQIVSLKGFGTYRWSYRDERRPLRLLGGSAFSAQQAAA